MKNQKIKFIGTVLMAVAVLVSCNKDRQETVADLRVDIETIVEHANHEYLSIEIFGGDEQSAFRVDNEGLIDEYVAREDYLDMDEKSAGNRLIQCLRSVNLERDQIPQVRRALMAYEKRNERIIHKHREAFSKLHARMEAGRQELIRQLRSGEIDRMEFRRKMAQLRDAYQQALRRIKESNAEAFSASYRMFMQNLREILNERQWNTFTTCLRR